VSGKENIGERDVILDYAVLHDWRHPLCWNSSGQPPVDDSDLDPSTIGTPQHVLTLQIHMRISFGVEWADSVEKKVDQCRVRLGKRLIPGGGSRFGAFPDTPELVNIFASIGDV
tara:strand:- start:295 stop:636 length:342 start_codon:yes stop_codon:yes gene_type:complete